MTTSGSHPRSKRVRVGGGGEEKKEDVVVFEGAEARLPYQVRSVIGRMAANCEVLSDNGKSCLSGFRFKQQHREAKRLDCADFCLAHCSSWLHDLKNASLVVDVV